MPRIGDGQLTVMEVTWELPRVAHESNAQTIFFEDREPRALCQARPEDKTTVLALPRLRHRRAPLIAGLRILAHMDGDVVEGLPGVVDGVIGQHGDAVGAGF